MLTNTTRVVIAEDNELVRTGIRRLLNRAEDIAVVGEAKDGVEAIHLVDKLSPDLLLLDVEMPRLSGIEVARRLNNSKSKTRILVLSAYDDQEYIHEMLTNGASGYLIKDEAPQRIIEAVREVAQGEAGWISSQEKNQQKKRNT